MQSPSPFGHAVAGTVQIEGVHYNVFYGTSIGKNNVIGDPNSGIPTPSGRTPWKAEGSFRGHHIDGVVTATIPEYAVDWYFIGAESGNINTFFSGGISFSEDNQNNNYDNTAGGWQFLGTTTGSGANTPIDFTLVDTAYLNNNSVTNGDNNKPGSNKPSLIFSYATPSGNGWELTLDATDWFVFAFNDPGSTDKDFDDYMGVGHVYASECPRYRCPARCR